jgi:hypothetical protein
LPTHRVPYLAALLAVAGCGTAPSAVPQPPSAPTEMVAKACRVVDGRADAACTPGALNPQVTQDTIHTTMCLPGWTDRVAPPAQLVTELKLRQMREFAEPGPARNYKEDHLIPLSIGGAPSDPRNLFPQPAAKTTEKEDLEEQLHKAVCAGQLSLADAQAKMKHDWTR